MGLNQDVTEALPIKRKLTFEYASSLVIVTFMALASCAGLLYQSTTYPNDELLLAFVPNDVANLIIGVPILLGSLWLTRRGKLVGLLSWPGAIFYVFYTYLIYVFSTPLSWIFILYLVLLTLSVYTLISLVATIDSKAIQQRLTGSVPEKAGGIILTGFGLLFLVRVIGLTVVALLDHSSVPQTDLALNITDFLISPALIIGGVMLLMRKAFGYVVGLGLLFQASMLFIGLIFILILQPFMLDVQFMLSDVLVVTVMGMVCFVPLVLFVRGTARH